MNETARYVRWFEDLRNGDVPVVGGKNASLGEMIANLKTQGIRVPGGFATTADAFREYVQANHIETEMRKWLDELARGTKTLDQTGSAIRRLFRQGAIPEPIAKAIVQAYAELSRRYKVEEADVAVRSSATAEDLPDASFAGQQETYLNVTGEHELLEAIRNCYASLFTDRAIVYRQERNFDQLKVALSAGVQKMVRSDKAGSGVMFSLDTETGFRGVVLINAAWGLGENVVQGSVNPDEYMVFKPLLEKKGKVPIIEKALGDKQRKLVYTSGAKNTTKNVDTTHRERTSFVLSDEEIMQLARWAVLIEKHYQRPMDMEWAKDGLTKELYIVQARPETVQSRKQAAALKTYQLKEKATPILTGLAVGQAIAAGTAEVIADAKEIDRFKPGSILVTGMTDPDWVPIMKKAAAIVTDYGGRTAHAAIVARELGIPAVVGTGQATHQLKDGQDITVSCAEGDVGYIYDGILKFQEQELDLSNVPATRTRIMMNIGSPSAAFRWWRLPAKGVGLARMEFIINNFIKVHPLALIHLDQVTSSHDRATIRQLTRGYADLTDFFVDQLARGIAQIAATQYPEPVVVRTSDFKTNEYANLIGGTQFEPHEDNPMLGFRGASRYYSDRYREGFALECRAMHKVRETMGLDNVILMIPFCRTVEEADRVLGVLATNGLNRGENGLEVYVMCEIPSNVILADEFAKKFDGFSIGSNDLTQLVLGVDRDSGELAFLFDERNPAVTRFIHQLIDTAKKTRTKVGICGQAPSDHPEFAKMLVEFGIDSISVNPDSVLTVIKAVAAAEKEKGIQPETVRK
jgi:pyruvate,water dikinase